ncbi:MAG: glycerol-3-phosphate dehydrogenase [Beijerinckiaceae bacterium]|nr:glycerol-3-phosphate dehydrogenase [Beijerinckiaceae bacterium]
MKTQPDADLLIIGGGINGAGIARDASGRGLKVMLCEQGDLAGATSSASSKLIHGGLRYLEYYRFGFVREALKEREVLLGIAPHIVWPARFILPHDRGLRPAFLIEVGLLLYDWLAPRKRLERSRRIDLRKSKEGAPLKDNLTIGFVYSDCRVDDARLVVLNAADARERGADIRTRTRCISAKREQGIWQATLFDLRNAVTATVTARILVNAAGPWAAGVLNSVINGNAGKANLRLVKGSHIIVPRLYEGEQCYVLQNEDRRIVFVMPYETDYSLIGTTDIPFDGDPAAATISAEEVTYLCASVSRNFRKALTPQDVIESFSGVRPLYGDSEANASAITREYVLALDAPEGCAPLLSVFGGKVTTYRRLAEDAIQKLVPYLGPYRPQRWTAASPLPGGDMEAGDSGGFLNTLRGKFPWLDAVTAARLARAYGTRAELILGEARSVQDLGIDFGAGLTQAEADYLMDKEFACTAEDILWRRTKLHLHLSVQQMAALKAYVDARSRSGGSPDA